MNSELNNPLSGVSVEVLETVVDMVNRLEEGGHDPVKFFQDLLDGVEKHGVEWLLEGVDGVGDER
jgi:hypothetical protein